MDAAINGHYLPLCRFEVEDVDDPFHKPPTSSEQVVSTTSHHTAASIGGGYNTSEAIPKTVYYRDQDDDKGLPRPSLDALHDLRRTDDTQHTRVRTTNTWWCCE